MFFRESFLLLALLLIDEDEKEWHLQRIRLDPVTCGKRPREEKEEDNINEEYFPSFFLPLEFLLNPIFVLSLNSSGNNGGIYSVLLQLSRILLSVSMLSLQGLGCSDTVASWLLPCLRWLHVTYLWSFKWEYMSGGRGAMPFLDCQSTGRRIKAP